MRRAGGHAAHLMHPGDAFFTPGEDVDVLALPAAAPWMTVSEAIGSLRAAGPPVGCPFIRDCSKQAAYPFYYSRFRETPDTDWQVLPCESAVTF